MSAPWSLRTCSATLTILCSSGLCSVFNALGSRMCSRVTTRKWCLATGRISRIATSSSVDTISSVPAAFSPQIWQKTHLVRGSDAMASRRGGLPGNANARWCWWSATLRVDKGDKGWNWFTSHWSTSTPVRVPVLDPWSPWFTLTFMTALKSRHDVLGWHKPPSVRFKNKSRHEAHVRCGRNGMEM